MFIQLRKKFLWYSYYDSEVLAQEGFDPWAEHYCTECNDWIASVGKSRTGPGYHWYACDPNNPDKIISDGICESVEQGKKLIAQILREHGYIC